ncbi:MAG: hypothetical protein WC672_14250 [Acidithiobacillus sp.]|jgi:hypothetical protein
MDAVLSRFADNLHNLNQRRENDANRQRQSRARKKAGKTGHVTPSLGRHVTASVRRRDYIENNHVFSLL